MELNEIIMDALHFPFNNISSLIVYLVLGLIASIIAIFTGVINLINNTGTSSPGLIVSLIGLILCLIIYFVINGYELDIMKSGISRSSDAPSIDITRQIIEGVKLFVVQLVYFIIPLLLTLICALIFSRGITMIIGFILFVLFAFVETMGECRLAKTEDLNYALKVNEAIGDMERIGVSKVIITILVVGILVAVISYILSAIFGFISQDLNVIVSVIVSVYLVFFENRATGLLYSDLY